MTNIFTLGLNWDSITITQRIEDQFKKMGFFTDDKGRDSLSSLGFSNDGRSAFIINCFDLKNNWGLKITIPNDKRVLFVIGGKYDPKKLIKSTYHKRFKNLALAEKYLMKIIEDYKREFKK